MEAKKEIRERLLAIRESMNAEEWEKKTEAIAGKVTSHPLFCRAGEIYCYMDFRREAGTRLIMERAWEMHKKVAVPRTEKNRMDFYYISDFDDTSPGRFGIAEPEKTYPAPGKEGLILMPGAVFDEELHRIGYGGGFYDRYLMEHTSLFRMALAFEFQVLPVISWEEHDICPRILVTEERVIERKIT